MSLYKSWFIDYEPFDLDDEGLPVGWYKAKLNDKLSTSTQSINPQKMDCDFVWHYSIPAYDNGKLPSKDIPSKAASVFTPLSLVILFASSIGSILSILRPK